MLRKDKEAVVREAARLLAGSEVMYVSDYRGLSVADISELRTKLREQGASMRVLKNTLTRRAAAEAGREVLVELLSGPTAITFCSDDPVGPAKALEEFAKSHQELEVRGGLLEGQLLDADGVEQLSLLPPRDALIGQFVGTLAAPMTGLVTVLQGSLSEFVRALQQIVDQKSAAEAS